MNLTLRLVLGLMLVVVLLFAIFGFVATFEPLDASIQMKWRCIHGILGLASLVGLALIFRHRVPPMD